MWEQIYIYQTYFLVGKKQPINPQEMIISILKGQVLLEANFHRTQQYVKWVSLMEVTGGIHTEEIDLQPFYLKAVTCQVYSFNAFITDISYAEVIYSISQEIAGF